VETNDGMTTEQTTVVMMMTTQPYHSEYSTHL